MFKKSDTDYAQPEATTSTQPRSTATEPRKEGATIGPSISIKGDLSGDEDLIIQGRVEGKIDLKRFKGSIDMEPRAADKQKQAAPAEVKAMPKSEAGSEAKTTAPYRPEPSVTRA